MPRWSWWHALALTAAILAALPDRASAACGPLDLGACVDGAQYTFWLGIAKNLWSFDRALLQLTYSIGQLRWWMVETGFGFVYRVLQDVFGPLLGPAATVALLVGLLATLLAPLLGRNRVVNLRHALVWTALAPVLLAAAGGALLQAEQARTYVGGTLLDQGVGLLPSVPLFGAQAHDMTPPRALYAGGPNPCGTGALTRRDAGLRPDDLAAALVGADAQDIHCPNASGESNELPDAFYDAGGPVFFATVGDVGNDLDPAARQAAVSRIQAGVNRLALVLLPCLLAVLDATVQLVLALALMALWLALPVGLLVVFFQQTAAGVTGLFRRAVVVFQVSWSSSVVLGVVLVCLRRTAELSNATAYTGFAIGALVLTGYALVVAFQTLGQSIRTLNDTVALATGLTPSAPLELASGAAAGVGTAGLAAATGGASLAAGGAAAALTGAMALRQTGSGRYALGAAAGRLAPLAKVGAVASAMGAEGDLVDGLFAGQRSVRSLRTSKAHMAADARRTDGDGLTPQARAQERQAARHFARRPLRTGPTYAAQHSRLATTEEQPGPDALDVSYGEARVPRLLALGYRVQRRPDNRLNIWKPEPDEPPAVRRGEDRRVAAARQRLELVRRGGLVGDVQRTREELHAAVRLVEQERQQAATPPPEPAQETQQVAPPAPQSAQEQPGNPASEATPDQQQGPTATPEEKP